VDGITRAIPGHLLTVSSGRALFQRGDAGIPAR
jgi:hypothetical protein